MKKAKERTTEPSSGELAVKAIVDVELSGKDKNGDFALIVACLALQTCRGGRGEHGEANYKMEAVMARWSGC